MKLDIAGGSVSPENKSVLGLKYLRHELLQPLQILSFYFNNKGSYIYFGNFCENDPAYLEEIAKLYNKINNLLLAGYTVGEKTVKALISKMQNLDWKPSAEEAGIKNTFEEESAMILDLLAIVTSPDKVKKERVSLDDFLKRIIGDAEKDLEGTKITLMSGENLQVNLDPKRMRFALNNIFRNARKHGKSSDINVTYAQQEASVMIKISDNGIGLQIDRDKLLKGQPQTSETTNPSQHGLGLDFTQKVIEGHGGNIHIQNNQILEKQGSGVTIIISLPINNQNTESISAEIQEAVRIAA